MDTMEGKKLITRVGKVVLAEKALKDAKLILYYFNASWSEHSLVFGKKLRKFYEELGRRKLNFHIQIISVSSDTAQEQMMEHFMKDHGDWYTIPFGDPTIDELVLKYGITSIPMVVVVKNDGTEITRTGRKDVEEKGINSLVIWTS